MAGALSRYGVIVMAAGLSRRMGGPNKLLQPYRGQPLLAHALDGAAKAGLASRVVVTGRDSAEIEALAAPYGFRCVHNARFAEGLGASIATGASAVDASLAGVFIALGDMPELLADDYSLLATRFAHGAIAVPVYKGARGHPVLFCTSYLYELSALWGEEGARSILKRPAARCIEVETDNRGILRDVDTPEDFKKP
jgi:molybdenum cofactor cytidylyltransferase